jgi:hypothetical protein
VIGTYFLQEDRAKYASVSPAVQGVTHYSWVLFHLLLCNISKFKPRISIRARCTRYEHYLIVSQSLTTGRWFSSGILVSSTNETERHDITEILLNVALNTITLTLIVSTTQSKWE